MASKALWALHFDRNKSDISLSWTKRFYELDDLESKTDRPYAPLHIDTNSIPGSWKFKNSGSVTEIYAMCDPYVIDEDNIVTVFNFAEGQMVKALKKMECVSKKIDTARSSGSSP